MTCPMCDGSYSYGGDHCPLCLPEPAPAVSAWALMWLVIGLTCVAAGIATLIS